ncbi:MAG: tetratricopeptide repeat protein [Alphaproteobacteria bacterium]
MTDLKKRAESGDAEAQNQLAAEYLMAEPPDFDEAVKWLRMAADQGNAGAQNNLGTLYINGEGVKQGDKEAAKLFRKAAEQGTAAAQANLGNCCAMGRGVPQSWEEAYFWWSLGFNDDEGAELLAEAASHLTPEQKAVVAQRIADAKHAGK